MHASDNKGDLGGCWVGRGNLPPLVVCRLVAEGPESLGFGGNFPQ